MSVQLGPKVEVRPGCACVKAVDQYELYLKDMEPAKERERELESFFYGRLAKNGCGMCSTGRSYWCARRPSAQPCCQQGR